MVNFPPIKSLICRLSGLQNILDVVILIIKIGKVAIANEFVVVGR